VKYAFDFVVMMKEETALRGMVDRLTEIGRWYLMEKNEEKFKVM
jgi:hypothetical protein